MRTREIVHSARTISRALATKSLIHMRLPTTGAAGRVQFRYGMLLPIVELIAWPGAGHSTASASIESVIASAVTLPFAAWLLRATRRKPPITSPADRPPNQFGPPPRAMGRN